MHLDTPVKDNQIWKSLKGRSQPARKLNGALTFAKHSWRTRVVGFLTCLPCNGENSGS
jgi:hypothetical protein